MARKLIPRIAGAAALVAALVAALTLVAGTGSAQTTSAAQANYAPKNTAAPTIKGTAQVGQTLAATPGSWTAESSPAFSYQWLRCDTKGAGCKSISGATKQEYQVQSEDSGNTLRVVVTATTKSGSTSVSSGSTSVVPQSGGSGGGIEGAIKLQNGKTSIPASTVGLPQRLIIDGVKFTPTRLTDRTAFVGQFHVSDTRGYVVRDVLVKVTGLPYSWAHSRGEVRTGQDGWAQVTIVPTRNMPIGRRAALVMFVRARVEGQSLLAGASARRLVQVTIR